MTLNPSRTGSRIDALTSTRAFAALLVVVFHFGTTAYPFNHLLRFFSQGNIAVSYFFVLSGFVMSLTYFYKPVDYITFIQRRFARIAPAYYLALLLSILPFLFLHFVKKDMALEDNFLGKLVLNVFFLQAYVPGYALSLNGPGWSLSVEWFFYLLFPGLLFMMKKKVKTFIVNGLILFVLSQLVHCMLAYRLKGSAQGKLFEFTYYQPLLHLNEFVVGMIGSLLYFRLQDRPQFRHPLLTPAALILTIAAILYNPYSLSYHDGFIAPLFALFILAVALGNPAFLRLQPLVFMGEISYGIYILQRPVWYFVDKQLNPKFFHLPGTALFYVYTAILIVVAGLSYYLIERPCRRWLNGLKFMPARVPSTN
jgi:peptidoglycan/LPS O-acetylase OafA/YrhL